MTDPRPISYAEFGHNFITQVVTARRLGSEIQALLDSTVAGSVRKLPADMMVVSYVFQLRDITVDPMLGELPHISFVLSVLGDVRLDVDLFGMPLKFSLAVKIRVRIDVETFAPVVLGLTAHPVTGSSISIDLVGENLGSDVLDKLMIVQPVVRDQIVKEVNARIADLKARGLTRIDVLSLVENVSLSS